jgi:hypothetical protein
MQSLDEAEVSCPYCGEIIQVLIDGSIEHQNYIEDCQVCCRPIVFATWSYPEQPPRVEVRTEDDTA